MNYFSTFLIVLAYATASIAGFDCTSTKPFQFSIAGYISGKPDAVLRGNDLKKDDSTPRVLFKITNVDPAQESTYPKAFDIGIYRFVKNEESKNGWDIYRKNAADSKWIKQSDLPNPLIVFKKQSVVVRITGKNQLTIQRLSGDDKQAKEMTITTNPEEILVQTGQRKYPYSLKPCLDQKHKTKDHQVQPQKVRT